jgi:hypothetical protein
VRNDVTSPWLHRLTVFFLPQNTLAAPPTGARPQAVPVARPAAPGKPVSAMSMGERIFAMFVRMQEFLPGAAKKQLAQTIASLASPEAQLTLVACLTFLAVSQAAGVGEVADALLLSWAYATLGWSGLCAMYRLLGAVVDAATAQDDAALTAAARSFAANLTTLGTDVLLVFVTWAARRAGKGEAAEKDPAAADPARRPARGVKPATPVRDPTLRSSLSDDWFDSSGNVRWPPNRGFAGDPVAETLQPGTIIDRYGEDAGRYFSPAGTSYAARALPYDPAQMNYTQFEVLKPLPVEAGPAEAWFDQAGGGTQYFSKMNAQQLLDEGYIRKVSP